MLNVKAEVYWIVGPCTGHVGILLRPRGGDWLEDEVRAWKQSGVDVVVSLLTPEEVDHFGLEKEPNCCYDNGIECMAFRIDDRSVPSSLRAALDLLRTLAMKLRLGKNVGIHCRQGIGRSALIASGLLIQSGMGADTVLKRVSDARGCPAPETEEQLKWVKGLAHGIVTVETQ